MKLDAKITVNATIPQPNDLCKCGHTREEHARAWHRRRATCGCKTFMADLWTEEEIAEVKRKAAEYADILGWKNENE